MAATWPRHVGDRSTDRNTDRQIEMDAKRREGGSEISSLVATQRAAMKERFRVRQGITKTVPEITDAHACTVHSLYWVAFMGLVCAYLHTQDK